MTRVPFDPMKSAAMRDARVRKAMSPDAPPLGVSEERALIEAAAIAAEIRVEETQLVAGGTATKPLSVKQVNAMVNQVLTNALPPSFFIQGEISNFRVYDRGHAFFTLKEAGAELPCVFWKDGLARLKFKPKDGMAVIARGAVKLYEPQGKLQLYVDALLPQGAGALELAFRQLCEKLKAEGLFEAARKRPIPKLPQRVVIITSRTGDVLHDVLTTAYRRFPGLHTMLYPVRVQGEQAATEIANAIKAINRHQSKLDGNSKIDLILLVRGGGSLEDLWAFNEEILARAICASAIPIATGIGHEPDTTIADLVGDLRGPTPTGITELTIPDVRNLLSDLNARAALLTRDITRLIERHRAGVDSVCVEFNAAIREAMRNREMRIDLMCTQIGRIEPRHAIAQGWRRVEEGQRTLHNAAARRLRLGIDGLNRIDYRLERCSPLAAVERQRNRIGQLTLRLESALAARRNAAVQRINALETQLRIVSPQSVLDRGFSITTDNTGKLVRSKDQVKKGDLLTTRVADGTITSTVGKPKQSSLF
jgi:exodeoxyribonuclease VII large subunit